jgi:hypothetical protein
MLVESAMENEAANELYNLPERNRKYVDVCLDDPPKAVRYAIN